MVSSSCPAGLISTSTDLCLPSGGQTGLPEPFCSMDDTKHNRVLGATHAPKPLLAALSPSSLLGECSQPKGNSVEIMPKASLAELLAEAATGVYRALLGDRRALHPPACLYEHSTWCPLQDCLGTGSNSTLKWLLCCRKHPAQGRNARTGYEEGIGVVT